MAAASAMAILAGCGGSSGSGYTASAKASFLKGCESGSNATVCTCMLQYFEAHVSASKLIAATQNATPGHPPRLFFTAARSCANQQTTTT
jgi:hypothetical protein